MSLEQGGALLALVSAALGLIVALTVLVKKVSRYMDARITLAETQAASAKRELEISERDLELREFQVELDRRKLLEMRWSRKVQQEACGLKKVPGVEETGRYHLDEGEMAWTREERPLGAREERPREGGPVIRGPKDDDGTLDSWASEPDEVPQQSLTLAFPTMWG